MFTDSIFSSKNNKQLS